MTTEATEYANDMIRVEAIQTEIASLRADLHAIPMLSRTPAQWAKAMGITAAIDALSNLSNRIAEKY